MDLKEGQNGPEQGAEEEYAAKDSEPGSNPDKNPNYAVMSPAGIFLFVPGLSTGGQLFFCGKGPSIRKDLGVIVLRAHPGIPIFVDSRPVALFPRSDVMSSHSAFDEALRRTISMSSPPTR